MTSTFSGLSTALSALYAQRRGLDVTGQNIANANTDGYSRQRVNLESIGAPAVPALWSTYQGSGSGVAVTDVARLRDAFLENRGRIEQQKLSLLTGQQETLATIERTLQEPSSTALQSQLSDMWSAWHNVANQPSSLAARSQLLGATATLADGIRQTYTALDSQWTASGEQLAVTVSAANATARNVAELNEAIRSATRAGLPANELADKRDLLVMQLVDQVGATARSSGDGMVDVYVGGTALVRGDSVEVLALSGSTTLDSFRTSGIAPVVVWAATGDAASTSGRAGAYVEALGSTIPSYANKLDSVVANLTSSLNAAHVSGYDLDGNPGTNLFAPTATAKDITSLVTDPRKVAAAGEPGATLDGSNAQKIAEIERATSGADALYRQLIVELGTAAQTANRRLEIQSNVALQVNAAREAQAGVNIDEEMVNLLSFQRGYEAAARVISAVDEVLDTLINRTGLVGR